MLAIGIICRIYGDNYPKENGGKLMKYIRILSFLLITSCIFIAGCASNSASKDVLRLHIVANSDTQKDQDIKLRIRDKVLESFGGLFSQAKNVKEAEDIVRNNEMEIKAIADEEINESGESYTAAVDVGRYQFPTKLYGEIAYPAGEYEAVKIVLGSGEGKNWWCVMFPPLCMIDAGQGIAIEKPDEASTVEYRSYLAELYEKLIACEGGE